MWGVFEAHQGDIEKATKLLKVGHALNPRDPVILQSLALIEYKHTSPDAARMLFQRASKIDPRHQPVWMVRAFWLVVFNHLCAC
jgi:Flp pilus assembly protein TadD